MKDSEYLEPLRAALCPHSRLEATWSCDQFDNLSSPTAVDAVTGYVVIPKLTNSFCTCRKKTWMISSAFKPICYPHWTYFVDISLYLTGTWTTKPLTNTASSPHRAVSIHGTKSQDISASPAAVISNTTPSFSLWKNNKSPEWPFNIIQPAWKKATNNSCAQSPPCNIQRRLQTPHSVPSQQMHHISNIWIAWPQAVYISG